MKIKKITYVIPCYNEAEVLPEFYRRVNQVARDLSEYSFEFLFINDGSDDRTAEILNAFAEQDDRTKILHFAKNRGHQIAITAGLDFATGDVIVIIDADLQDPPELAKEMIQKVEEGFEVIHAQRRKRSGETFLKLFTASLFYRLMRWTSSHHVIENCGDFRAVTRPVSKAISGFRERHRFMRGIFSAIGFKQCILQYDRDPRYAGQTKYPFKKMLGFSVNAILSFSATPVKTIMWISFFLWGSSLIYLGKALADHFVYRVTVPGWTSLVILLIFLSGTNLFCLGILGSYVIRIFEQGQKRPLYWLADTRNVHFKELDNTSREIEEVKLYYDSANR
ncbi:MAG TPA: glycosyltransferase family 2 protein [Thermodesulfovibrionales bacterium]|nr:glycosyltransferase family 2 protein [Thermodesulfovibrionales bacterium]